ncbi:MAG: hypothetical protein JWP97_276 [Labilithrix sp.]|nr:hypothetical protein [Labilithrix sp.]
MANIRTASFTAFTALTLGCLGAFTACSNDTSNTLGGRVTGSSGGSSGQSGDGGVNGEGGVNSGPPAEEVAFHALEADLAKTCGGQCHEAKTYKPTPPGFLSPPDAYKSIKSQPGIVVADYYQSTLLNKGGHAGPAIGDTPELEAKVIEWLKLESIALTAVKAPTIDPVAIKSGPNDIDMTKASISGLTGTHFLFDASLVGGILSISNLKVKAAAGTDVHVYHPRFIRVLAAPNDKKQTEVPDGADTFSNTDQTVPGGADTTLNPGAAFFTSDGWAPFDFNSDKLRIEVEKLEPGKISVVDVPKTCKNVAMFTANVLPSFRGGGGVTPNCQNCHNTGAGAGTGLSGLAFNAADNATVCNQVLAKLNEGDIAKSRIVTHLAAGDGHSGGAVNNITNWTALFVNNKGVFF